MSILLELLVAIAVLTLHVDYGPVIRFDYRFWIDPYDPPRDWPLDGEWRPMEHSSFLLSQLSKSLLVNSNFTEQPVMLLGQRFGYRSRPYTAHAAKLLSSPLAHELTTGVFREAFQETSKHPLRGMHTNRDSSTGWQVPGKYDAHLGYLFGNFVVERYREALLWSWVVGKIGGGGTSNDFFKGATFGESSGVPADEVFDDEDNVIFESWARADRDPDDQWESYLHGRRAWSELGGDEYSQSLKVTLTRRDSLDFRRVDKTLKRPATSGPIGTAYTFCECPVVVGHSRRTPHEQCCFLFPRDRPSSNSESGRISIRVLETLGVNSARSHDVSHALAALDIRGSLQRDFRSSLRTHMYNREVYVLPARFAGCGRGV